MGPGLPSPEGTAPRRYHGGGNRSSLQLGPVANVLVAELLHGTRPSLGALSRKTAGTAAIIADRAPGHRAAWRHGPRRARGGSPWQATHRRLSPVCGMIA